MNRRTLLQAIFGIALAVQLPSQASACRVGWDQHLFEQPPPSNVMRGAKIIRVHFSNAKSALSGLPRSVANPDGQALGYSLIGMARLVGDGDAGKEPFPVYAIVTSCSGFWAVENGDARKVVDGEYYLIGRFQADGGKQRFHAGGVRTSGTGPIYAGWHF